MRITLIVAAAVLVRPSCASEPARYWQIPPGVRSVGVNGYEMAYAEKGAGTPVVLVHGAMADYRYFAATANALPETYRVIAVSLRHYYPEPWDGHLVGPSRGGTVALYVATFHPELVRSLVLPEGGANMPAFDASIGTAQPVSQRGRNTLALFERGNMEEGLRYFMDDAGGPGSWNRASDLSRQLYRDNAWTVKGVVSDALDPYNCADARRIRVPVLLLSAQRSPAFRAKTLDAVQACLANSERAVVPNAGHSMPRDNPRGFAEAVHAFIARN